MYLRLKQGSASSVVPVISAADMEAVFESELKIYQKLGERYYELRVKKETARDAATKPEYAIDNWVPLAAGDVPKGVESGFKEQPQTQGARKPSTDAVPPAKAAIMDPNFRNSAAAKDAAAGMGAGNLALKDPIGQPHDGLPAANDKQQPNQSREGQQAQSVVLEERLNTSPGATENSKPAAPLPASEAARTAPPAVPGPKRAPKEGEK